MTHQRLDKEHSQKPWSLSSPVNSASMISRRVLADALALCDAASFRLPFLELSLARGLVSLHAGAADVPRSNHYTQDSLAAALKQTGLGAKPNLARVTSLIQRRDISSEEAFREYGRNFGNGGSSVGGIELPNDDMGEASYPEGLDEEEYMDDEEQQESKDEREMRQQLLRAALSHVVCSGTALTSRI